jgi:hypothetical protein
MLSSSPRRSVVSPLAVALPLAASLVLGGGAALASSHREAPGITAFPKLDATDFYMFRSYEPGREDYVTLIADYVPLQDAYGGPNYFDFQDGAQYSIHVDNTGDGVEDLSFVFQFRDFLGGIALPVGGETVPIPLLYAGQVTAGDTSAQNFWELFSLDLVEGELRSPGSVRHATARRGGSRTLATPFPNVGRKTFPDYEAYARRFVHEVDLPGCGPSRVFVGQRKDPFVVNLGETFDLVNLDPLGPVDGASDALADKNVLSIVLEVPISCLTEGITDVIGGWTTARIARNQMFEETPEFNDPVKGSGQLVQVSRLGMPLVNEVVIGVPDKNRFNGSRPDADAQFATYVTNPTLPELLELLFGVQAPNNFPRQDLLAAFVTGIDGLNAFGFGEMQRLNVTIPPAPKGSQQNLGALAGDFAGFPNGRRPGDDVVDIELRVAMGVLCHAFPGAFGCGPEDAPSGTLEYTDGAVVDDAFFADAFPYLATPVPGSPNAVNGVD